MDSAKNIQRLPTSGSSRTYFRKTDEDGHTVIQTVGTNIAENEAFFYIQHHFEQKKLPVPHLYAISDDRLTYTQQDLGDTSLFDFIANGRKDGIFTENEVDMLKETIKLLAHVQIDGVEGMDWSKCYPTSRWDAKVIGWDLSYFKYCFLKNTSIDFNENFLESDFETLSCDLLQYPADAFLYRDFQSRNVMIYQHKPYLIDFQGGRKGPIYYDIVSFLWQAKAHFNPSLRKDLLKVYWEELKTIPNCPTCYKSMPFAEFLNNLTPFILFRNLQVLGAYGYRGLIQKKSHFNESIRDGLINLKDFFSTYPQYQKNTPYLSSLASFLQNEFTIIPKTTDKLTVSVISFSYRNGIPGDLYGNGGGYVFDCRAINNPGRLDEYKNLTGCDKPVIDFIEKDDEMGNFLNRVYALIDTHIENYIRRGFTHLQIAFGCTGGQHRSVYAAEHTALHIKSNFDVEVHLNHLTQQINRIL